MRKFKIRIGKSVTGIFETPGGRIVRTPVEFECLEKQLPLVEARLRMGSITDFSIQELKEKSDDFIYNYFPDNIDNE